MRKFFILSIFVGLLAASCRSGCSNHGSCVADTCLCNENYAGADCSIYDEALVNNRVSHGDVFTREWRYYHILAVSDRGDLIIEVNQTSATGDCDTYVRLGDYPNRQTFDYRDISTQKNARIEISHPEGTYYIGVYGFLGSSFDILANSQSDCENDCSGNGLCASENLCSCYEGWAGNDCGTKMTPMVNSTVYSESVGSHLWNYYSFDNTLNTLVINVSQTDDETQDCDLYVRSGTELPSLVSYDYRDTTTNSEYSLKISEAESGQYSIGIYGFKKCDYSIVAESVNECPNLCSGTQHGLCASNTCQCNLRFTGDACETMLSPLIYDSPMTGFVEQNAWNWYHFTPRSTSNILVSLVQESHDMDCDMYIRRTEEPDRTHYDYRDITFSDNFTITIESPSFETYHIGVLGYKTCAYSLVTSVSLDCPNSCTDANHGTCQDGHCLCKDGWTGDDCSEQMNLLQLDSTVTSSIPANEWKYYSFNAKMGYEVTILLRELNSTGFLWLYEARDSFPTMAEYDNSDTESNMQVHDIVFTPESDIVAYIGVFASPLSIQGQMYGYKLVAWQASGLGVRTPVRFRE
eukprot:CAMPEP_0201480230 /NCGR_PEP_ID=MMETSP0151_2-20130828/4746_1 /ASSEMBLY_ACC=CAM_ASM_000257 /TAXON_ID=200890 /ORGANISM="Paramoeba atlantica, Strain 621/1 / CCAP 1560/9" /LENGTH=577 /DNA_ID=CAMNT_0047862015 /DNA_START=122 /DNA_END=1855 /DNA_ORIENTATION=-